MSIHHHPDPATLMSYASGTLDEAFALVVSCHLSMCGSCKKQMLDLSAIGGNLLEAGDNETVDDSVFDELMGKIRDEEPVRSNVAHLPRRKSRAGEVPIPLQRYIGTTYDKVKWKRVGPGTATYLLPLSDGAEGSVRLLRIAPKCSVPEHGHGDQELTLILDGAYTDELGHFGAGDVADLDEHIEHQPKVTSEMDCICLAATSAPTRFKSFIPRMLQPLIGI
ncbi:MAG: ChrR family anti-sigma-E factor [Stappiaceae bacterium]